MSTVFNDQIPTNLPILDSKNYDKCSKQTKVLYGYQKALDFVNNGVTPLGVEATTAHQATFKEEKKKDYKTLLLIHSFFDSDNFEKVSDCELTKQAWEILEKAYVGAAKAKVVRSHTHKRQFELTHMEEKETINNYVTRITHLVNQIKAFFNVKIHNIVVAIKESKNLASLSKDDILSSLEAHEQIMDGRGNNKAMVEISLQARLNEKRNFSNECGAKQRDSQGDKVKVAKKEVDDEDTLLVMITEEFHGSTEVLNSSCSSSKNEEESHSEQNVMTSVRDGVQGSDEWYLDSGCSTHVMGRKDFFVQINQVAKSRVKFADDSTLAAESVDVLIEKKNGRHSMIKDMLYTPAIKCNLLSIGQLLDKGYKIRLEDKILRVVDASGVLILKAPMASNMTFKVELKVLEHRCLATAASREELIYFLCYFPTVVSELRLDEISQFLVFSVVAALSDLPHKKRIVIL
ncbi:uncharacterized protein LOC131614553 [Vicia villosa]|uniref:uncharacterized protein LOC131614553 n=1 Tax=Vicia villosa TaxID=3911 RepID=UPI00273B3DE8|nr:uncharacterized protein LOC131614553 [Vicia villosa]